MCQQFVKHVNSCHTDIPRMREGMVGAQVHVEIIVIGDVTVGICNLSNEPIQYIELLKQLVATLTFRMLSALVLVSLHPL